MGAGVSCVQIGGLVDGIRNDRNTHLSTQAALFPELWIACALKRKPDAIYLNLKKHPNSKAYHTRLDRESMRLHTFHEALSSHE